MTTTTLVAVDALHRALAADGGWDALVWVRGAATATTAPALDTAFEALLAVDAAGDTEPALLPMATLPGGRLVMVPTGPLLRDQDDVRRFAAAAERGVARALRAGSRRPLLLVSGVPDAPRHAAAVPVAALGAAGAVWQPLEARESRPTLHGDGAVEIGLACVDPKMAPERLAAWVRWANAVEAGRCLTRDLCGTEPERMAPAPFAAHCEAVLAGTGLTVTTRHAADAGFEVAYPLLSAVGRASMGVARHRPCVVRLVYEPDGPVTRTLLFAGKGVTYDTGGADLKVGGAMAGMSRDKGGAAAVAGLMRTLASLKPAGVRVVAELGLVRNSIGADAFVTDEIVTSHAGVRVRIGNTDAEGRLVLADLLSHLREDALGAPGAELFSVATLTGHAARSVGPYTAVLDNGPARTRGTSATLEAAGDRFGDPFDPQRLRPEDWAFVAARTGAEDVVSCNNAPSSATARGHQFPVAFLAIASGLASHAGDTEQPLAFTHVDIAGSAVENGWQHGRPSARPLVGLLTGLLPACQPQA